VKVHPFGLLCRPRIDGTGPIRILPAPNRKLWCHVLAIDTIHHQNPIEIDFYHYRFPISRVGSSGVPRTGTNPMADVVMLILILLAVPLAAAYARFCRRI
jgi:hypothetical protein